MTGSPYPWARVDECLVDLDAATGCFGRLDAAVSAVRAGDAAGLVAEVVLGHIAFKLSGHADRRQHVAGRRHVESDAVIPGMNASAFTPEVLAVFGEPRRM
jgi:hypothetical protein